MKSSRRSRAGLLVTVALASCVSSSDPTGNGPPVEPPVTGSTGAFLIRARTSGVERDTDGYSVLISPVNSPGSLSFSIGVNDSIVVTHQRLGSHASYWMQLRGMASNCWPVIVSFTQAGAVRDQVTPVDFFVECIASNRNLIFDRVSPHSPQAVALHGSLREVYILSDDDRFRVQYESNRFGMYEYLGTLTRMPNDELTLAFEGDTRWQASGRLRSDSLVVVYNELMVSAEFEPGLFLRRAAAAQH